MSPLERKFRLNDEPDSLGVSCSSAGVFLAGIPLLRKTGARFKTRPAHEIDALIRAAYGADIDPAELVPSLASIAVSLNYLPVAKARIAAGFMRLPDLDRDAVARLAQVEQSLISRRPEEPKESQEDWYAGSAGAPDNLDADTLRALKSRMRQFESKYDGMGPVEFAKEVIRFGEWLGREGRDLIGAARQYALAEYVFVQDRLSFWLSYGYKPAKAQPALLAASMTLCDEAGKAGIDPRGAKNGDRE